MVAGAGVITTSMAASTAAAANIRDVPLIQPIPSLHNKAVCGTGPPDESRSDTCGVVTGGNTPGIGKRALQRCGFPPMGRWAADTHGPRVHGVPDGAGWGMLNSPSHGGCPLRTLAVGSLACEHPRKSRPAEGGPALPPRRGPLRREPAARGRARRHLRPLAARARAHRRASTPRPRRRSRTCRS